MASTASLSPEKKHWWLSNKKIVDRYIKDARSLIGTQEPADVSSALSLLDAALSLYPRHEAALELKARCLLYLRRFKDVADMLQEYIPSFKMVPNEDSSTSLLSENSSSSSQQLCREKVKLLPSDEEPSDDDRSFRCFSVSDLKRKVLAGLGKTGEKEGQWRYLVLGQACSHLGMMEDAMVLLQTGKRLANAAVRRESLDLTDDDFSFSSADVSTSTNSSTPATALTESESAAHLLTHIKLLLRRRAAAVAALDAGLPSESVRHFSKILDGRRGTPHAFAANCLVDRAAAYRAAGRLAESMADCNRALALDPACIPALRARADLLESVRCFPDCLRDLDHLKLLYDSILRDRKLPGPAWKPHHGIRYGDIPASLRALNCRIQELRQRMAAREGGNVDYFALIGVRRGCSRSEIERAHLLLSLKHRPDKAAGFVDRLEFADENRDLDAVRDQARMSSLILYRLIQKGYSSIMTAIMDEEAAERKKQLREAALLQAAVPPAVKPKPERGSGKLMAEVVSVSESTKLEKESSGEFVGVVAGGRSPDPLAAGSLNCGGRGSPPLPEKKAGPPALAAPVFQGVFCRDLAVVGSLLSQAGFNRPIQMPVKYEGLSC